VGDLETKNNEVELIGQGRLDGHTMGIHPAWHEEMNQGWARVGEAVQSMGQGGRKGHAVGIHPTWHTKKNRGVRKK
jgi:hypothetical protein